MATVDPVSRAPARRRLSLSLAGRLSLVTAGVVAVALGLVSTVRTLALRQQLYRSTALQMALDYNTFLRNDLHQPGPLEFSLHGAAFVQQLASPSVGALVAAPTGEVLYSAPNTGQGQLSPPALAASDYVQAFGATPVLYRVAGPPGARQLVVLEPLVAPPATPVAVFELATPVKPLAAMLRQQLEFDVLAGLLALAAASGIIYLLLGRFLEPLQAMARASGQIARGESHVELPEPRGDDEVSRLSAAFSHMVDRIDSALEGERAEQRRVRAFLADASHSLRTPLTVLNGRLDLLLHGESREPELLEGALRDLRVEGERMARIVRGLLLLARLDEGGERPPGEVAVGEVLSALTPRLEALAGDRQMIVLAPQGLKAWATVEAVETVVTNLVENAVRYTPEDGTIEVRADLAQGRVRLRVLDTGVGIAPGDLARIFDRFFRGAYSGQRRDGGAGLGLSIVQRWTEALGGTVEAANRTDGRGAMFTIWLPAPPSLPASAMESAPPPAPRNAGRTGQV